MEISIGGMIVCACVLAFASYYRSILIVGLLASLAFGSTAWISLSSLGGSSPLIFVLFAILMLGSVAAKRTALMDLGAIFGKIGHSWVLLSLLLYAAASAWLFPRLFGGQTSVFVQSKTRAAVVEAALAPTSTNISQTGYLILGGLTTIAMLNLLLARNRTDELRRGFFALCILHCGIGLLDLFGKFAGIGDILAPIRTANYALLTEQVQAGFWRIAGAYSEASAFGAASLCSLAFCYTYWRKTGSRTAQCLAAISIVLLLLSTSTTAYVGLTILSVAVALVIVRSFLAGQVDRDEVLIIALLFVTVLTALALELYNSRVLDPFAQMIDNVVINKAGSASGQERAYWNQKSIESVFDTSGLGVGFGSSRSSSWPISVISQLGIIGSLLMATLVAVLVRGLGKYARYIDPETGALVASVRAYALAGLLAASISGGSADPGIAFFIALAVVAAARARARRNAYAGLSWSGDRSTTAPPMISRPERWLQA